MGQGCHILVGPRSATTWPGLAPIRHERGGLTVCRSAVVWRIRKLDGKRINIWFSVQHSQVPVGHVARACCRMQMHGMYHVLLPGMCLLLHGNITMLILDRFRHSPGHAKVPSVYFTRMLLCCHRADAYFAFRTSEIFHTLQ